MELIIFLSSGKNYYEAYIVISDGQHNVRQWSRKLLHEVSKIENVKVVWIRPLTRRLQRLFGWGDTTISREALMESAKNGKSQKSWLYYR